MGEYITKLEMTALAYADIILKELNEQGEETEHMPEKDMKDLPPFTTVRCVCGKTEPIGDLIKCRDCKCFLHRECIDPQISNISHYRCPFCRLQIDGIDPFKDLKTWISEKDVEIRTIHKLLDDINKLEPKFQMMEYPMGVAPVNTGFLSQVSRTAHDVSERIIKLADS